MSRISAAFSRKSHKALIPYVTVGYPDIEATLKIVPVLADAGADVIELGIPFSDPLADGATIQNASSRAIDNGVTTNICLETAKQLRKKTAVPLIFMSYYNPIYRFGIEKFCSECEKSSIDGLIIPDLPPEEGGELENIGKTYGLDLIYLLAPTSTRARIRKVAAHSGGFIYLVSVTGVTGARQSVPEELSAFVKRVRQETDKPLCVGFGISTTEQAKQVVAIADGVIVGSRLIQLMEDDATLKKAGAFCRQLRKALDDVS